MSEVPVGRGTWRGVAITVAAIAVGAAVVAAVEPLRDAVSDALRGDHEAVRDDLRHPAGVLVVVALAAIHSVIFYPSEILITATGFVYGFWPALPLLMACWVMNALISYAIGRNAARPIIYRLAGRERFERTESAVARGGVPLLLAMRLIPVIPFSLFSIAAGAAKVPVWRLTWTTAVGYLPLTAYFAYLGSRLETFDFGDPVVWVGGVALLATLIGLRYVWRVSGTA